MPPRKSANECCIATIYAICFFGLRVGTLTHQRAQSSGDAPNRMARCRVHKDGRGLGQVGHRPATTPRTGTVRRSALRFEIVLQILVQIGRLERWQLEDPTLMRARELCHLRIQLLTRG